MKLNNSNDMAKKRIGDPTARTANINHGPT